jgi:hypothetical protein
MLLALLLACPGPTPPPVPPNPPSEWVDIAKPPGSADGVRCWAWTGVDPVCQWPSGGPVPPPPLPPEPPKAEAPAAEAPAAEAKP